MTNDFAAAMQQAALSTRALDVTEATRIIQEALARTGNAPTERDVSRSGGYIIPSLPKLAAPPGARELPSSQRPRKPLKLVLKTLRGLRQGKPGPVHRPVRVPEGAQYLSRSFTAGAGTRPYKLYIPASAPDAPRGTIVMLHGCTQNPDDFALGTNMNAVAERHGLLVVYPQQTQASNNLSCWNWFNPADQARGKGEPSLIAGIAQEIAGEFGLERSNTFIAGLSAGGAMAAVLAATYPDVFAAAGIHSGLAYRAANDVVSAFAAMRGDAMPRATSAAAGEGTKMRFIVFHGSADATVHPSNAKRIVAMAESRAGADLNTRIISRQVNGRMCERSLTEDANGTVLIESWLVADAGHAWFGGDVAGSYADRQGPDASSEMARFFLQ